MWLFGWKKDSGLGSREGRLSEALRGREGPGPIQNKGNPKPHLAAPGMGSGHRTQDRPCVRPLALEAQKASSSSKELSPLWSFPAR